MYTFYISTYFMFNIYIIIHYMLSVYTICIIEYYMYTSNKYIYIYNIHTSSLINLATRYS